MCRVWGKDLVLADSFGRIATDLRVSLTDRCNLRCSYCMPPEGLDRLPSPSLPSDGERSQPSRLPQARPPAQIGRSGPVDV